MNKIFEEVGTPLYLYRKEVICENYKNLKAAILPGAKLYYSMKANPLGKICTMLHELGAGIEVASKGELNTALQAGVPASEILFTSPGKTDEEIAFAVTNNIKMIGVDSLEELHIVNEIAEQENKYVKVMVRINPKVSFSNAKIKMSGVSSQFGVEEDNIDSFLESAKQFDYVTVSGFQIYMGTQMLLADDIVSNTKYALDLFLRLSCEHHILLEVADVGGGFGVKYFAKEQPLDLNALKEQMEDIYNQYCEKLTNVEVIFESGRFIMADAGQFITKVLYVKESKGEKYVICDGGSNFQSSAAFLGRFVRNNFPITAIPKGSETQETNVVGPLCTPLDVLGQKIQINSEIKRGDYVVIEKSGAYGMTYSPLAFLSHESAAEVMLDGEEYLVLRNHIDIATVIGN